ncbi:MULTISPECIES: hypothetical protein [Actinosynnema]|uniref:hypothetical protein n=1 Tax=Actinosynnema TaxID=40566 RepID=UPI0020A2915F|nr:hypothetical protein [Actinosynnema pretiosum]
MSTSPASLLDSRKAVTTVAAFRAELLRLLHRGGIPLTVTEMVRRTGRSETLFKNFLINSGTLPGWHVVEAVLIATGESSPEAMRAWENLWRAVHRTHTDKASELARSHATSGKPRPPRRRATMLYAANPATYATDSPLSFGSPARRTADDEDVSTASLDGVRDTPLNRALTAGTEADYVAALRQLRDVSGLSYGAIALNSESISDDNKSRGRYRTPTVSKSSAQRIATGIRLPPKWTTLEAYLRGCKIEGDVELQLWRNKWLQLRSLPSTVIHQSDPAPSAAGEATPGPVSVQPPSTRLSPVEKQPLATATKVLLRVVAGLGAVAEQGVAAGGGQVQQGTQARSGLGACGGVADAGQPDGVPGVVDGLPGGQTLALGNGQAGGVGEQVGRVSPVAAVPGQAQGLGQQRAHPAGQLGVVSGAGGQADVVVHERGHAVVHEPGPVLLVHPP